MLLLGLVLAEPLPTWIFLHALQLICHIPLLLSQLPPNAAYFISSFLSVCRCEPLVSWFVSKEFYLMKYGILKDGPFNFTFKAYA